MVLLNSGESIVRQGPVVRINPQGEREGVLTLTDRRLLFEAHVPEGPQGQPIVRTTIDAPLRRIKNAGIVPGKEAGGRLEIELPQQRALFRVPDANGWLQAIVQARANAPAPPAGGQGGPAAAPAAPSVMLRCRYCGLLNSPTVGKCTGCGAPI